MGGFRNSRIQVWRLAVYQAIAILDLWSERMGMSCDEEGRKFVDHVGILNGSNFHKTLYGMAKSHANAHIRKIEEGSEP